MGQENLFSYSQDDLWKLPDIVRLLIFILKQHILRLLLS